MNTPKGAPCKIFTSAWGPVLEALTPDWIEKKIPALKRFLDLKNMNSPFGLRLMLRLLIPLEEWQLKATKWAAAMLASIGKLVV